MNKEIGILLSIMWVLSIVLNFTSLYIFGQIGLVLVLVVVLVLLFEELDK